MSFTCSHPALAHTSGETAAPLTQPTSGRWASHQHSTLHTAQPTQLIRNEAKLPGPSHTLPHTTQTHRIALPVLRRGERIHHQCGVGGCGEERGEEEREGIVRVFGSIAGSRGPRATAFCQTTSCNTRHGLCHPTPPTHPPSTAPSTPLIAQPPDRTVPYAGSALTVTHTSPSPLPTP